MTFEDVLIMARNIIDEVDEDEQIDVILKSAINFAYLNILTTVAKKSTITDIPYEKIYTLPEDCYSIIDIFSGNDVLNNLDYSVKSNVVIFHNVYENLKLLYTKTVKAILDDSDVFDLDEKYAFACAMYGAYAYSVHRKRTELASLLLSDYNNIINNKVSKVEVNENDTNRSN